MPNKPLIEQIETTLPCRKFVAWDKDAARKLELLPKGIIGGNPSTPTNKSFA